MEMNYLKVYCNLIRKAENRTPPEGYTEKHHTFPKSIFGKNNRIVILTSREHYIAHALLAKGFNKRYGKNDVKSIKMIYAFWCMNNQKNKNTYLNSYLYECYKKKFSQTHSKLMKGNIHSEETKKKMSFSAKGKKKTISHRKKLSESRFGIKQSQETIQKRVEKNKGKTRTKEQRLRIGLGQRGKVISKKSEEKRIKSFCKHIYTFISPEKELFITDNARKFCRENDLHHTAVYKVCRGLQKNHKGWIISKTLKQIEDK